MKNDNTPIIILKNVNIIDGSGTDPIYGGTVVVRGERICEIIEGKPGVLPASATVIDGNGNFLLPGLIDAHVHIICVDADVGNMMRQTYASVLTIRALGVLTQALDQGFTTLRDCGGADPGFRVAVEQGYAPGPRLSVSGRHLSMTGGHGDGRWPTELFEPVETPAGFFGIVVDGVDNCRKAAREQLRQGVDFLKVMAGGGCMSPSDAVDTAQYSMEELSAIVWEAESAGTYVSAHCYSDQSIINSVEAGIRTIEHGNLLTKKAAEIIRAKNAFLVPTMAAYEIAAREGKTLGIPESLLKKVGQAREKSEEALSIADRVGCTIGSGSDLLGPMQRYRAHELTLKSRVLGPMKTITATTLTNAAIIGREHELGTIAAGKLADLILVDGNPLEDIAILEDYQKRICLVMQGGRIHKYNN